MQTLHNNLSQELRDTYNKMKMTKNQTLENEILRMLENDLNDVYHKGLDENNEKKELPIILLTKKSKFTKQKPNNFWALIM